MIPKSTDQFYAIPINCIAGDLMIQVFATEGRKKNSFPIDVTWRWRTEMNFLLTFLQDLGNLGHKKYYHLRGTNCKNI